MPGGCTQEIARSPMGSGKGFGEFYARQNA